MQPSISIIIPVYNEKPNISPVVDSILGSFGSLSEDLEVLFIDDNSPDGTADEVLRVSSVYPQVRLVQHGKKEGIGAAHLAGYKSARGAYVMCIDADLSQSASDLLRMKDKLDSGYDLVVGSRYVSGGKQVGKNFIKDFGSRAMNIMCRFLLGIPMTDCTHTFRAFRREVYEKVADKLDQKGHPSFQVQFSFWVVRRGYKVTEIPIEFVERDASKGQSKISVRREVPFFLKLVLRLMFLRFSLVRKSDG